MNNYLYTILYLCSIHIPLCGGGKDGYVPHINETGIEENWVNVEPTARINLNAYIHEEEDEAAELTQGTIKSSSKSEKTSRKKRAQNKQKIDQLIGSGIHSNSYERVIKGWDKLQTPPSRTYQWAPLLAAAQANTFLKEQQFAEKINSIFSKDIVNEQIELEKALSIKIFLQLKFDEYIEHKKSTKQLPITQSTSF